jgi:hypothetical protein
MVETDRAAGQGFAYCGTDPKVPGKHPKNVWLPAREALAVAGDGASSKSLISLLSLTHIVPRKPTKGF